jgi:hypothetical protein
MTLFLMSPTLPLMMCKTISMEPQQLRFNVISKPRPWPYRFDVKGLYFGRPFRRNPPRKYPRHPMEIESIMTPVPILGLLQGIVKQ